MNKKLPVTCALLLSSGLTMAQELPLKNVQINGWGFFRHETKKDADYKTSVKDKIDFNQTRLNVSIKSDLADNYGYVYFAPQFSKVSGQNEFVNPSNSSQQSSGALYDPRLDLHEAYIALRPTQNENFYLFAGRQELAYGDHLVLGSVPWHRIGRSFDGARLRYTFSPRLTADVFSMKLQENNATSNPDAQQDANFHGAYLFGNQGKYFSSTDLYVLKKENQRVGAFRDTTAYGARAKSKIGDTAFDYRAEGTLEQVRLAGETTNRDAYQYSVELGYTLPFYTTRFGVEYFDASKNYDQLFPTAHKFMGFADQFARRNLNGVVGHFSTRPIDKLSFLADYHVFRRSSKSNPAFNFAGASLGDTGSSRDVATELDLTLAYDFTKTVQVSYGYSWVMPGEYLKDQSDKNNAETQWSYLQLLVRF